MKPKLISTGELIKHNEDMMEYLEFENYYDITNDFEYLIDNYVKRYKYTIGKYVKIIPNPYIIEKMSKEVIEKDHDSALKYYLGKILINSLLNFDFGIKTSDYNGIEHMNKYYKYSNILNRLFINYFDALKELDLRMVNPTKYYNIGLLYNVDISTFLNNVDIEIISGKVKNPYTDIIDSLLYYIIMNVHLYKLHDPIEDNPSSYIIDLLRLNDVHTNVIIELHQSDLYENSSYDMNSLSMFKSSMYIKHFFNNLKDNEWDYLRRKIINMNDLIYDEDNLLGDYLFELYDRYIRTRKNVFISDKYSVLLEGFRKERNN